MSSIAQSFRYILRKLAKTPGFTLVSIFTLAVGIGANTAIFSVVEGVLIQPLPYAESERLVGLWHNAPGIGIDKFEQSKTSYTLYSEANRTFDSIGMVDEFTFNLTDGGDPVRIPVAAITASTFDVLRTSPARGRRFTDGDDRIGARDVVLLSDHLWRTRFGSAPDIVGTTLHLDGDPWEVIGVMPRGFAYPDKTTELWTPFPIDPAQLGQANFSYQGIGRLKPGVTLEAASADLDGLLKQMPERYPGELTQGLMHDAQMLAFVTPMRDDLVGDVEAILWILLGTVGFILLIACANVANLFLVRAEGRQKEVAVRTALGARFGDLVRYFLAESMVLSVAGGFLGLLLADLGVRALIGISPIEIPRIAEVGINARVLGFTAAISLVAGLLFGAFPILRYARPSLVTGLKEGGRGSSSGRETHRARKVLVAAQVALALVLLTGSGLMARSFWALRNVDPGFDPAHVLTFRMSLPETEYATADAAARFYQQLLDDLTTLPGVESAGATTNLPMTDGQSNSGLTVEGFPVGPDELPPIIRTNRAAPGYFDTMGIRVIEGREFERRDHENRSGAAIVNAALVRRFWPDGNALGKRVAPGLSQEDQVWYTIVGIVEDIRDDGMAGDVAEMVYFPIVPAIAPADDDANDWVSRTMSVAIRTRTAPSSLARAVQETVWALDPRLPLASMRTAEAIVAESLAPTAFTMLLLGIAAAVALLLGAVGIYGVVSYVVVQRTREIGVRMALGAQRASVSRMVVGDAMIVAASGVVVGLAGAFALTRLMDTLLFGVSATDPLTFAGVAMALFVVTALASYLPARRAATVSPMEALRYE